MFETDDILEIFARTPIVFWPWLALQFMVLEAWCASLGLTGDEEIWFGVSDYGTIQLVSMPARLQDGPHSEARPRAITAEDLCTGWSQDYLRLNILLNHVSAAYAPRIAAKDTTPLYLDPG